MSEKIGFMQGRLSPVIDGKIQAFPWQNWRAEIRSAQDINISIMEWTLDQERLHKNPLMTDIGQKEICALCKKHNFFIPSVTGDCFMQAPFWKAENSIDFEMLKNDFEAIVSSCNKIGVKILVMPLVDCGSIENLDQENCLVEFLSNQEGRCKELGVKVAFESDFPPAKLKSFISRFNSDCYGINYDSGNSAALGFNLSEEFNAFGKRIINVHVKDRTLNGGTVALGHGAVNFKNLFSLLKSIDYSGNYILQTARAEDEQHIELISKYRKFVQEELI
jgi:L-ribulose-5-phosphate 3-epimerase